MRQWVQYEQQQCRGGSGIISGTIIPTTQNEANINSLDTLSSESIACENDYERSTSALLPFVFLITIGAAVVGPIVSLHHESSSPIHRLPWLSFRIPDFNDHITVRKNPTSRLFPVVSAYNYNNTRKFYVIVNEVFDSFSN